MAGREGRLAQLTASLNRMLEQLDRAFGRDRHLMKEASDELHDPVRAIRRELALLGHEDDADETAAARERAATATSTASTRCSSEMEAVASAGRPGAVRPAPVALQPVPRAASATARARPARRPPDRRDAARRTPSRGSTRRWVERALLHMLDNAAIHGRCSSPVAADAPRACRGGWRFEVADEGGGVPAGHEDAVFEPFYRAAAVPGRAGLGLALVRSVAEAHGGSTGILNRPGVGATFWLRVPA